MMIKKIVVQRDCRLRLLFQFYAHTDKSKGHSQITPVCQSVSCLPSRQTDKPVIVSCTLCLGLLIFFLFWLMAKQEMAANDSESSCYLMNSKLNNLRTGFDFPKLATYLQSLQR